MALTTFVMPHVNCSVSGMLALAFVGNFFDGFVGGAETMIVREARLN